MTHLIFLSPTWKVWEGELPEKPDLNNNNNLTEFDIDDYNEAIAAIKRDAVEVLNEEVIKSKLDTLKWVGRIENEDVYEWKGGVDYLEKLPPVAILKLPEEKQSDINYEDVQKENEALKEAIEHLSKLLENKNALISYYENKYENDAQNKATETSS